MENKEDKTPEEASNLFHNIMKASVRNSKEPQEYYRTLQDGTKIHICEVGNDKDGNKRYVINSEEKIFDSFTWTPNGVPSEGDKLNHEQAKILKQISNTINK